MFLAAEQLDETAQALGWKVECRQMSKGTFSAKLVCLESETIHLAFASFNTHLHIHCEPPERFIAICLPQILDSRATACGFELEDGDLIVFPSRSEMDFSTIGEITSQTLFLPEKRFLSIVRSIAPGESCFTPKIAAIYRGDPDQLAVIRREMISVRHVASLGPETASRLLAHTILWMTVARPIANNQSLTSGRAATVVRHARTYVEDHLHETIRAENLAKFAGVGLRTLERCFAWHFQISPTAYIKARRLNAARRELASADPEKDTIASIARRSGFSHPGRFSVEYRTHFGESPRKTLSKTRIRGRVFKLSQSG